MERTKLNLDDVDSRVWPAMVKDLMTNQRQESWGEDNKGLEDVVAAVFDSLLQRKEGEEDEQYKSRLIEFYKGFVHFVHDGKIVDFPSFSLPQESENFLLGAASGLIISGRPEDVVRLLLLINGSEENKEKILGLAEELLRNYELTIGNGKKKAILTNLILLLPPEKRGIWEESLRINATPKEFEIFDLIIKFSLESLRREAILVNPDDPGNNAPDYLRNLVDGIAEKMAEGKSPAISNLLRRLVFAEALNLFLGDFFSSLKEKYGEGKISLEEVLGIVSKLKEFIEKPVFDFNKNKGLSEKGRKKRKPQEGEPRNDLITQADFQISFIYHLVKTCVDAAGPNAEENKKRIEEIKSFFTKADEYGIKKEELINYYNCCLLVLAKANAAEFVFGKEYPLPFADILPVIDDKEVPKSSQRQHGAAKSLSSPGAIYAQRDLQGGYFLYGERATIEEIEERVRTPLLDKLANVFSSFKEDRRQEEEKLQGLEAKLRQMLESPSAAPPDRQLTEIFPDIEEKIQRPIQRKGKLEELLKQIAIFRGKDESYKNKPSLQRFWEKIIGGREKKELAEMSERIEGTFREFFPGEAAALQEVDQRVEEIIEAEIERIKREILDSAKRLIGEKGEGILQAIQGERGRDFDTERLNGFLLVLNGIKNLLEEAGIPDDIVKEEKDQIKKRLLEAVKAPSRPKPGEISEQIMAALDLSFLAE